MDTILSINHFLILIAGMVAEVGAIIICYISVISVNQHISIALPFYQSTVQRKFLTLCKGTGLTAVLLSQWVNKMISLHKINFFILKFVLVFRYMSFLFLLYLIFCLSKWLRKHLCREDECTPVHRKIHETFNSWAHLITQLFYWHNIIYFNSNSHL